MSRSCRKNRRLVYRTFRARRTRRSEGRHIGLNEASNWCVPSAKPQRQVGGLKTGSVRTNRSVWLATIASSLPLVGSAVNAARMAKTRVACKSRNTTRASGSAIGVHIENCPSTAAPATRAAEARVMVCAVGLGRSSRTVHGYAETVTEKRD